MAIDADDPIDLGRYLPGNLPQDTRDPCNLGLPCNGKLRRCRFEQHLGGEDKAVADNPYTLSARKHFAHTPKELRPVICQILSLFFQLQRFLRQSLGFFFQPDSLRFFQFGATALFRRGLCQRSVKL